MARTRTVFDLPPVSLGPPRWVPSAHFRFAALRSRTSRAAVRFFAAASDAFLARADRSSGVIVSRPRQDHIVNERDNLLTDVTANASQGGL